MENRFRKAGKQAALFFRPREHFPTSAQSLFGKGALSAPARRSAMKLYQFPFSPNCQKVVAIAHEVGMPLQLAMVDLFKGEARYAAFSRACT
jgi:hypothetical protein